ncbi:putative transposase [Mesorhizobium amorphae CCNWGS0123]|uniref:Putative transposase n=1 Tax=Mesorhizobium amorphae CCNWGS0123 TaxID=1082933 RepID=G6YBP2_9HYPH|nr:putative transposase [Mesorhizobium amorphae CCNWGS0123]
MSRPKSRFLLEVSAAARQAQSATSSRVKGNAEHRTQGQPALKKLLLAVPYRDRNAIERMFGRLKDFRRYDRSATNFLAAVCLVAIVSYSTGEYSPQA